MGFCLEIVPVKAAMSWLVQIFFTFTKDHRYKFSSLSASMKSCSMVWCDMKKVHWGFNSYFFDVFRDYMIMEIVSMSIHKGSSMSSLSLLSRFDRLNNKFCPVITVSRLKDHLANSTQIGNFITVFKKMFD